MRAVLSLRVRVVELYKLVSGSGDQDIGCLDIVTRWAVRKNLAGVHEDWQPGSMEEMAQKQYPVSGLTISLSAGIFSARPFLMRCRRPLNS